MDGFREAPKGEAHKEIRNVVLLCAVTGAAPTAPSGRGGLQNFFLCGDPNDHESRSWHSCS